MAVGGPALHRKGHWYRPRSIGRSLAIRPRLYFSAMVGMAALVLLPVSAASVVVALNGVAAVASNEENKTKSVS